MSCIMSKTPQCCGSIAKCWELRASSTQMLHLPWIPWALILYALGDVLLWTSLTCTHTGPLQAIISPKTALW